MQPDAHGFLRPAVADAACTDCGLCTEKCPVSVLPQTSVHTEVLTGYAKDGALLPRSSSGAIFPVLAAEIIRRGGLVFGAAFDESFDVVHTVAESMVEISALCSSKYVQGRVPSDCYAQVKAALAAGRWVYFSGLPCQVAALRQAGCRVESEKDAVRLTAPARLRAIPPVRTSPYPGFPTDAQAVLMAALLRSRGTTVFVENMFDSRYRHVPELVRLGADIRTEGRVAVVCGAERLHGARVRAADLRGGAALVLAGLQAEGTTEVEQIHHIERGYADLVGDLRALGAEIRLREA